MMPTPSTAMTMATAALVRAAAARWLVALAAMAQLMNPARAAGADLDWPSARALMATYCWSCHGQRVRKADLDLESPASPDVLAPRLDALAQRLAGEEMPPPKARQPSAGERAALIGWVRAQAAGDALPAGDPGPVVMARLTATQYERAIRALTGLDLPLAGQLPHDAAAGEGFDNVGDAQRMTPMHLQAYLQSARQVLTHARILPGLPIRWMGVSHGHAITTAEVESALMVDWREFFRNIANRAGDEQRRALVPLIPLHDTWAQLPCLSYYSGPVVDYLVVYLHAAWQYRYRAQLGHPDWTTDDVAAHYQPPLHAEPFRLLVGELSQDLADRTGNLYWPRLVREWLALPPPPMGDQAIRDRCGQMLDWLLRHAVAMGNDGLEAGEQVFNPYEIPTDTWLVLPEEPRTVMITQGLHPFRLNLTGRKDIWLVTTDAGDGGEDDVMLWEHGVIVRDGLQEPWTSCAVTDQAGAPVAFGSHPRGAAAKLAADAIGVQAPTALHLALPPGTTELRVDARADPQWARNGSMQVYPFDHAPSQDQLHFMMHRYVFAAPGSARVRAHTESTRNLSALYAISLAINYRDFASLLPPEVRSRWGIKDEPEFGKPRQLNAPSGTGRRDLTIIWSEPDAILLSEVRPTEAPLMRAIADELVATIESRDLLAELLRKRAHFGSDNPADALGFVPQPPLPPELEARRAALATAARADEARLEGCARAAIGEFAARAWRRPPSEEAMAGMLALYRTGRAAGECFEAATKRALECVLISPHFIYREQRARAQAGPYALEGRELAERLAATLWGTLPDQDLLSAADRGALADPVALRARILAMLADPRAIALADDFAGQAYLFAGFDHQPGPDRMRFPAFTDAVRADMLQECRRFFAYVFQADRPLTEVIDADYTFANAELADFYGLAWPYGRPWPPDPGFKRVAVDRARRGGALGLGAILAMTSPPLRTSPIKRGAWVLSRLLGTPPPPPPPVVPQFSHDDKDDRGQDILQQMRAHRADPRCMSCHSRIDPLGVALEGFDPLGRVRRADAAEAAAAGLDATIDGAHLTGLPSLKAWLLSEPQRGKVMRNLCAKFAGYAFGRRLLPSDDALLDRTMADLAGNGWRSSTLVLDILASSQFLTRRGALAAEAATTRATP